MSELPQLSQLPRVISNKNLLPQHKQLLFCGHNENSQVTLHNHPDKSTLTVCKSCFRTVIKDSENKQRSNSSKRNKKNRKFAPMRIFQKEPSKTARVVNRERKTLKSRNKMREV